MNNYESTKKPNFASSAAAKTPVAIVGARGYSGLELARLLLKHPKAQLQGCFATDHKFQLKNYLPEVQAQAVPTWILSEFEQQLQKVKVLFLATPAEVSMELAPTAVKAGVHVIDLSGAFRLKMHDAQQRYHQWYGFEHQQLDLLQKSHFGLQPWALPANFAQTQLVANPGCYATAVMMALVPLLKAKAIEPKSLVIDAKSGTSGAGRKANEAMLFTEVEGECLPYKVGVHQHLPEIVEGIQNFSGQQIDPFFNTHLLNVRRGIIASIYGKTSHSENEIEEILRQAYSHYPLVRLGRLGTPEGDALVSLKRVVGSARTHLAFRVVGDKLFLFSLIDNLLKGAASQAVENLNCLLDQPHQLGLQESEGVL